MINAGRLAGPYSPADVDAIVAGMEDQRGATLYALGTRIQAGSSSTETATAPVAVAPVRPPNQPSTASTSAPPANESAACAVDNIRARLTNARDASCEQIWRYHIMRRFLINYVSTQRALMNAQGSWLTAIQSTTKQTADVIDLILAFTNGYKAVFSADPKTATTAFEMAASSDDIVETVTGLTDNQDCGVDLKEGIKLLIGQAISKATPQELLPSPILKVSGCIVAYLGERTQVLPARNSLILVQDIVVSYYKNSGDIARASSDLGVTASTIDQLISRLATTKQMSLSEYNPLTTRVVISRLTKMIDGVAAQCVQSTSCSAK
jgi:hypothetical protein